MRAERPIIIAGAGLGGAALALALARRGRSVLLVEAASELGAIGYGIQLGPNVFPMFRELGVEAEVLAHCHFPPNVLMLDALDGSQVTRVHTGAAFVGRYRDPYVAIHRADLHQCLIDACRKHENLTILTSTEFATYEQTADLVRMIAADGRTFEGAALIGADGLGSKVRASFVGEQPPVPIGYVAHRTIVPMERVPAHVRRDEVILWGGPGFHIVQYPLRNKSLYNIVAVFRTDNLHERADEETYRSILMRTYADAHPTMLDMLRMMNLERRWVIADRDPIRNWSDGRVALLGDAAHPTLQSYAQGACMAFEDAVVLGRCIALADDDFLAAFKRYEQERVLRTARVILESRTLWDFYHLGGIARDVRNAACARRTDEDVYRCLDWIYEGVELPS